MSDPYKLPYNDNLPPGVSSRDIDPPMRECETCGGSGSILRNDVEGTEYRDCPDCGGIGEVKK